MSHGWALIAATFSLVFTLPGNNAGSCGGTGAVTADIESLFVWFHPQGKPARVIQRAEVRHMEGVTYPLDVPSDTLGYVWCIVSDTLGNRPSCGWDSVLVGPALSVKLPPPCPPDTTVYDVAGRVMLKPLPHGLYFTKHGKAVVVR